MQQHDLVFCSSITEGDWLRFRFCTYRTLAKEHPWQSTLKLWQREGGGGEATHNTDQHHDVAHGMHYISYIRLCKSTFVVITFSDVLHEASYFSYHSSKL